MKSALEELHELAVYNAPQWVCLLDTRPGGLSASAQLMEDLRSLGCETRQEGRQVWFRLPASSISAEDASPRHLVNA